jgi:hypothetical protein
MTIDLPYHVIHNILEIADLSIESKIAFKLQKSMLVLWRIVNSLNYDQQGIVYA